MEKQQQQERVSSQMKNRKQNVIYELRNVRTVISGMCGITRQQLMFRQLLAPDWSDGGTSERGAAFRCDLSSLSLGLKWANWTFLDQKRINAHCFHQLQAQISHIDLGSGVNRYVNLNICLFPTDVD